MVLNAALVVWQACAVRRGTPPAFGGEALAIQELRGRRLELPVAGAVAMDLRDSFHDPRGSRLHQAVDILAPRGTPVRAVEDGTIARLLVSPTGGTSVYQLDPGQRYCYYYAHLLGYAAGLHEGQQVRRSQVIGYVGTTGNAAPNAPHLHFAISRLDETKQWWRGTPINPLSVLR
jgi:murein DD-endopeptidase MepM/ murein hydrolase activator NlpD